MRPKRRVVSMLIAVLLLLSLGTLVVAEDTPDVAPDQGRALDQDRPDPPGRVARLQYIGGSVSIQPRGQDEWVEGSLNRPLTSSDNVWTDKNSKAELNVGTGVFRMNSETSLTLTNVGDSTVQVQLHQGLLSLHVRHLYDGEIYEIDTPNMAFTVQKAGDYRFDVDPDGDVSTVTVWKGEGDATGDGPSVRVKSKETARFMNGTSLSHQINSAPGFDAFDDWCKVRNEREDQSVSARYVSRDVIGSEDLDAYGTWREEPPYGPVWVPAVAPGWAPYHYGHWAWVEPWGWTWVDDAPWGFAPFHYGRWVYYNNYWGWAPGPLYARPVYAPALVAFFGGDNFSIGVSFGFGGGIGWCPLGFGEPFYPFYGGSRNYFRNVNITNTRITNITNITNNYYNNRGRDHGRMPYNDHDRDNGGKPSNDHDRDNYGKNGKGNNDHDRDDYGKNGKGQNDHDRDNYGKNGKGNNDHDRDDRGHGMPTHYANAHVPGGFTAVPHDAMANGRPIDKSAVRVSGDALKNVRPIDRVPVNPTRVSALGGNAVRPASAPPARAMDRPVVSRIGRPTQPRGENQAANSRNQNQAGQGRGTEKPSAGRPLEQQSAARPQRGDNQNAGGPNLRTQLPPSAQRNIPGQGNESRPNDRIASRSVPRPPQRGVENGSSAPNGRPNNDGFNNNGRGAGDVARPGAGSAVPRAQDTSRSAPGPRNETGDLNRHNVPRPPQGGSRATSMNGADGNSNRPAMSERNISRPAQGGGMDRPPMGQREVSRPSQGGMDRPSQSQRQSVPRPTGRVMPARDSMPERSSNSGYSGPSSGTGYGRGSASPRGGYNDSPRSYGGPRSSDSSRQMSAPRNSGPSGGYGYPRGGASMGSYGGPRGGGSPSYGAPRGGSMSGPAYHGGGASMGSNGGSRSGGGSPSYSGPRGGSSAPSYHGGGGGGASSRGSGGGGGRSSGGGGNSGGGHESRGGRR